MRQTWEIELTEKQNKLWMPIDRWVAVIGSCVPVGIILGVVAFQFFMSLAGLVWIIGKVKCKTRRWDGIVHNTLFWPLMSWFAVVLISRLTSGGNAFLFVHDFVFLRYPLFVIAMLDTSRRLPVHRYLIGGLIAGIGYAGLNLLSAHLIGYDLIGKPLSRYIGKMNEGIRIGGLCAYAAPFLLLWAAIDDQLNRNKRVCITITGCMALFLLVSSQVRTALIAALIGFLGALLIRQGMNKKLRAGLVLAMVGVAGIGVWGVIWFQPDLTSLYDRFYIWKVSWYVWLRNPIFGVGISSFNEAYRQIAESGIVASVTTPSGIVYQNDNPRHAHNLFLQLMACNGFLGLGAFSWVFIEVVHSIRRHFSSWQVGLLSWPFVCIAVGMTGWNIYDPFYATVVFYFLAFITICQNAAFKRQVEEKTMPFE